jgi:hypothetical protein
MSQTVRYPGRAFLKVLQDHARGQAASDLDPQAVVAGSTLVILACSRNADGAGSSRPWVQPQADQR